ncbi:hypothetical protein Tco_1186310, partial [Tanacetum coccineum]
AWYKVSSPSCLKLRISSSCLAVFDGGQYLWIKDFLRRSQESTVPGGSLSTHRLVALVRVMGKSRSMTASCDTPGMLNKLTMSKTHSTCSWASSFLFPEKVQQDAEVFQKILDICPRVQAVDFAEVPYNETTLTFLIDLGYKGPLYKHPSMENVDYTELIWEDFAFQIDHRQLKKGRRKNMHYPRITKDIQEYGLPIPETMLTEEIKQSDVHKILYWLNFSQKRRRKGSQGKKTADTPESAVDVFKESDSEPARKQAGSRRVIKKKVSISADDNIIPESGVSLEIVTKSDPELARRRSLGIAFRDTSDVSKKMSPDP